MRAPRPAAKATQAGTLPETLVARGSKDPVAAASITARQGPCSSNGIVGHRAVERENVIGSAGELRRDGQTEGASNVAVVVSGEADRARFGEGRRVEASARRCEGDAGDGERSSAAAGEVSLEREYGRAAGRSNKGGGPVAVDIAAGIAAASQRQAQREQGDDGKKLVHEVLLKHEVGLFNRGARWPEGCMGADVFKVEADSKAPPCRCGTRQGRGTLPAP